MSYEKRTTGTEQAPVKWYYVEGGSPVGPLDEAGLHEAAQTGELRPETLVWCSGFEGWKPAGTVGPVQAILGDVSRQRRLGSIRAFGVVEADRARPDPQPETPSDGDFEDAVDLQDAVSDDEEEEDPGPAMDISHARAMPEQANHHSSVRWTASTSLPPKSNAAQTPDGSPRRLFFWLGVATAPVAGALLVWFGNSYLHRDSTASAMTAQTAPATGVKTEQARSEAARPAAASPSDSAPIEALPAEPAPEVDVIKGPLEPGIFAQKLQHSNPMFDQQCWAKYRGVPGKAENPSLEVTIVVGRWGQIYDLVPGPVPTGHYGVDRCIIGRMRGWKFPRAADPTRAVMTVTPGS